MFHLAVGRETIRRATTAAAAAGARTHLELARTLEFPSQSMLGFGVGTFVLPRTIRCEPISCESLQSFGLDAAAQPHLDTVAIFGLAVQATPRMVVRGGWQPHNLGGEELSSAEWFIAAGWRFGR